jgi:hypothetical protein
MTIENHFFDLEEQQGFLEEAEIETFAVKLQPICQRLAT